VTSVLASGVIIATGVVFFHVSIVWHAFGYFAAASVLGIACFFLLGAAVTTVVPKSESALPIAFGTMLPIAFGTMLPLAFISGVFFSVSHPPAWLHDLASAFPVAPIAQAMEDSFNPATRSWPMPDSGLLVVLGWSAAAITVIALAFRWEPGPAPATRGLGRSPRWPSRSRHGP
jgi:ABC-type transport system involved in multi-copper enzyme maturation permease subunit